jgi:uncharacterized protein YqhQ
LQQPVLRYNVVMEPEQRTSPLGGMALANGVLVHGPTAWGCAVRLPDGTLRVAAQRKRLRAREVRSPLLRGPARLLDAFAVLPALRRALPEARFPFERPLVAATLFVSAFTVRGLRGSHRLRPLAKELATTAIAAFPAVISLRGSELAAYHGAEHISIGSYEAGEPKPREHERCGSNLLVPLLAGTFVTNVLAARLPARVRSSGRILGQLGVLVAAFELFSWSVRNQDRPLARALARPGHELQHRLATAEPTADQLEVARAALDACLALERSAR